MTRGRPYDTDEMDEDDTSTPPPPIGNAHPTKGAASRRYAAADSPSPKSTKQKKKTNPTPAPKQKAAKPLDLASDEDDEVVEESDLDNEASTKSPAGKRSKEPVD